MSRQRQNRRKSETGTPSELRIIGGEWRSRKLPFIAVDGLRPTPDRVRETLFNWLAPYTPGARCLDLFAGSGALGLEALSRGALNCQFIEFAPAASRQLQRNLATLNCQSGEVFQGSALQWLQNCPSDLQFDLIFLDPPFRKALVEPCIEQIVERNLLKPGARVYLEMGSDEALPPLPDGWQLHREKRAGQITYRLYTTD